ncbi:MAG: hypothetical protein ACPGVB_15290, partial [Chitinophagales bacterium]
ETLKEIKEELLWLKIVFPSNFPIKAIGDTYCSMNCIPVINRRLIKYNYRLHRDINIVPLRSQELFFDVRSVYDREGKEYKNNPLTNLIDYKEETFSIRYGGVARFDQRTASEMLEYVLDLLKDESDAYKALDRDDLASDIQGIKQGLRRLENSTENITHINPTPYLIVKPGEDGDTVFVEFWTTNGEKGNRIRPESSLDVYSNLDVDQESLILVTASSGGRDKLKSADSLVAYKKAIMTRGRVATIEDVKTVCKYRLGKELKKVVVKKGVMLDPRPKFGLVTTIDVLLFPIKNTDYDEEEWTNKCMELKVELERQATITYPFRVDFEWTEDHFKIKQPV